VKPDIENIRSLNLEVVKLTTVQVTKQSLQHKICKIAKPVLTEDLCVLQKQEFFKHAICAKYTLDEWPSIFITDILIFSSERMLRKDKYRKVSVGEQISGRGSQGT
jgi:hypothetical protein